MAVLVIAAPGLAAQSPDNPVLTRAAEQDVASRTGGKIEGTDEERVRTVLDQLAASAVRTPADKAHAALIAYSLQDVSGLLKLDENYKGES